MGGIIRMKRLVQSTWNHDKRRFEPVPIPYWAWEPAVIALSSAEEFVDRLSLGSEALASGVDDTRLLLDLDIKAQVILIIQGMVKYHSKTKTAANREFAAAARAGLGQGAGPGPRQKKAVDRAAVEESLVELQVKHHVFIVQGERSFVRNEN